MQTTTRKGLPLPEVTDDDIVTYTVGPAGRTITTNGKVRETQRAVSTLLDGFIEYNIDEIVTGRWDFQGPFKTSKGIAQDFLNSTGGARVAGDVVILDPATDTSVIQPTALVASPKVAVVAESIANGAVGRVALSGCIRVKVDPTVTRLQYLQTQNASNSAIGTSSPTSASFAIALTNPDGANTVLAYLHPGAGTDVESFYLGTRLRSNAATVTAANLVGILYFFGFRTSAQAVTFPDPTTTNRPITVNAQEATANITITATGGSTVFGGSPDAGGTVQNGVVVPGDSYTYVSNGINWRAS
jgi:hypothetical protein